MKIVVVGSRGLIGSKTVEMLRKQGHDIVATSTKTGVNSVTGEGLVDAFKGAHSVLDLTNAPSWEDDAVMTFFEESTRNMLAAARSAGIKHYLALSVVGTSGLQESGYFRAKQKQEDLIISGPVPYTIVQATQFFEFLDAIADFSSINGTLHLSTAQFQPIAARDVSAIMAEVATAAPLNATVEIGGPERARMNDFFSAYLKAKSDTRQIVPSADAKYYGVKLDEQSLVPSTTSARIAPTIWQSWLREQQHAVRA